MAPPIILAVDDTDANLFVIKMMLTKLGYQVITAVDGVEAVQSAKENSPDLVLMDISMPNKNGIDAALEIQENYHNNAPPIVAVTANVTSRQEVECKTAGFKGFLGKPVNFNSLKQMTESLLNSKQLDF